MNGTEVGGRREGGGERERYIAREGKQSSSLSEEDATTTVEGR